MDFKNVRNVKCGLKNRKVVTTFVANVDLPFAISVVINMKMIHVAKGTSGRKRPTCVNMK